MQKFVERERSLKILKFRNSRRLKLENLKIYRNKEIATNFTNLHDREILKFKNSEDSFRIDDESGLKR